MLTSLTRVLISISLILLFGGNILAATPTILVTPPDHFQFEDFSELSVIWEAKAGATWYQVWIATDEEFTNIYDEGFTQNTNWSLSGLDIGTTYYWKVQDDEDGPYGPWSETWQFSIIPSGVTLDVSYILQEQSCWCWNACAEAVLRYYGNNYIYQCDIAQWVNSVQGAGSDDCCASAVGSLPSCDPGPPVPCNRANFIYGTSGSVEKVIQHYDDDIRTDNIYTYLTQTQVQDEIDSGNPFIFRWDYGTTNGHALVGRGISGNDFYYLDPGYGYEIKDYSWVVSNSESEWDHTLITTDDPVEFYLSLALLDVPEGGTASFQVRLTSDPFGTVSVSISRNSGDSDIDVLSGGSLSFDSGDWDLYKSVTLSASEDDDFDNGIASILVECVSGQPINSHYVTATEVDNDELLFILSSGTLTVEEGGSGTIQVRLSADPLINVSVNIERESGDSDINVVSGSSLIFDSGDWNIDKNVIFEALEDIDCDDGVASFLIENLSGLSIPDEHLIVTEDDNDISLFSFSEVASEVVGDTETGAGVSWVDYDGDGDQDLYLQKVGFNKLYRNDGSDVFDVFDVFTEVADGTLLADGGTGRSCSWADYDNDGDMDLYLSTTSQNVLLRNDDSGWHTINLGNGDSFSASWADYDNDGDVDLYVANAGDNVLFRNDGNDVFADVTTIAGVSGGSESRGVAWGDYDNDGDQDLYVTNLNSANKLYRNNGDGSFSDVSVPPINHSKGGGTEQDEGVVWLDYDNDGDLDLYVAIWGGANNLYRNDGSGVFSEISGDHECMENGYGVACGDYDNDGDIDIYVTNSAGPNTLLSNEPGGFVPVSDSVIEDGGNGVGVAWGDYDEDGDLDLYFANNNSANKLLRNDCSYDNHWVHVRLMGTLSNASAIGARARIVAGGYSQIREVSGGSGYCSQDSPVLEFGLGTSTIIDTLEIRWPSGKQDTLLALAVDLTMTISEGFSLVSNVIGNGSIARIPDKASYAFMDTVIMQADPDPGWIFDCWSDGLIGSENPDTVVMMSDTTITATFILGSYDVTVTTNPELLDVIVDDVTYSAPWQFVSQFGIMHEISVTSPQIIEDTIFVFSNWDDGRAITHTIEVPDFNSTYEASFTRYYSHPSIDSIVDIPGDQGGWVRIHLARSWYDSIDESLYPISMYNVWRRLDNIVMMQLIHGEGIHIKGDEVIKLTDSKEFDSGLLADLPIVEWRDRYFIEAAPEDQLVSIPPGTWEIVGSFGATQLEHYIYAAPTLGDSSGMMVPHTVYALSAHSTTPAMWFMSPPDSGYSVDNIAPGVPLGLAVAYNTGSGNQLSWEDSPESDFQYYRVYRGDIENSILGPVTFQHDTVTSEWTDPNEHGCNVYYRVSAIDCSGNESELSTPVEITGDDIPEIPQSFTLHQNVPNPFNPVTTIRFDLPVGEHVKISIFNLKGELVATILNRHMTSGRKEIVWNAKDNGGSLVASGMYFYRLIAGDFTETRKMILLR